MTGLKSIMRRRGSKKPDPVRSADLCGQLRALDHGILRLVDRGQGDMTLQAAGELVAMHQKLRRMRYQIEVEAGIDLK